MNDPAIYMLSFLVLTAGLMYLGRLIGRPNAYFAAKPAALLIDRSFQDTTVLNCGSHSVIIWILSCVRLKTYPPEDPDAVHHSPLTAHA
jgi:hypothetical protein